MNKTKTSEYANMMIGDGYPVPLALTVDDGGSAGNDAHADIPVWRRAVVALLSPAQLHRSIDSPALDQSPVSVRALPLPLRAIVEAFLERMALTPTALAVMVDQQRERLRAGGLRRSEDIETLTALVRLVVGRPLTTADEVVDIRHAYDHLKRLHWWTSGPDDLPLCALLAAAPTPIDELIARIAALHSALSEGDEVPDDALALILLCWSAPDVSEQDVVQRLRALRTELTLSGIPLTPKDTAPLPYFSGINLPPEKLIEHFFAHRLTSLRDSPALAQSIGIALAGDAVMLKVISEMSRPAFVAAVMIRAWMAHRRRNVHPPARTLR